MKLALKVLVIQSFILVTFVSSQWLDLTGYKNQYLPLLERTVPHVKFAIDDCARRGAILLVLHNATVRAFFRHYLKLNNRKYRH